MALNTTLCFYPIDKMAVTIHNTQLIMRSNIKQYKAGHVFGMLTLLADQTQGQKHKLPFRCVCGTEKHIALHALLQRQKSCGCVMNHPGGIKKPLEMDGIKFESRIAAAKYFGITPSSITHRLRRAGVR